VNYDHQNKAAWVAAGIVDRRLQNAYDISDIGRIYRGDHRPDDRDL
jgi:hypothetical protein